MVYLLIDIDGIVSELVHAVIFIYDGVMYVLYDKSDLHVVSKETLESTKYRMVASEMGAPCQWHAKWHRAWHRAGTGATSCQLARHWRATPKIPGAPISIASACSDLRFCIICII